MDCVGEDGAGREEGVGVVDVGVGIVRWEEGLDEGYFGGVFGDVCLNWEGCGCC